MLSVKDYITLDPGILGGQSVFKGTRVPLDTLFMHLEKGISLSDFREDFPSVSREQAVALLGIAEKIMTSKNIEGGYIKLLPDENSPKRLKADIPEHEIYTVNDRGWNNKKNGELLIAKSFDALLTIDKNLQYQQNFKKYAVPVFALNATDNTYLTLSRLITKIKEALAVPLHSGPTVIKE